MAYTKTVWKDQNVENPRTYSIRDNGDNTVTLLDAFGTVTELGTPVNATNMNNIEDGIKNLDTNKQDKITGAATTITGSNLTGNRVLISNNSGKVAASDTTSTELGYVHGVTSAIQTQINAKAADNAVVKLTGNQTIAGTKTFSSTIAGSINGNAATVTNGVYTTGSQTINGTKTFSSSPLVPTAGVSDNTTKAVNTAYINNKFQVVSTLPASPDADTFYFIPEV